MFRFTYTRGEWTDGIKLLEKSENEAFEAYLQRIGHSSPKLTIGSEDGSSIEIYESSGSQSFYACITPSGGTCYEVFLPDFPSFMLFVKDFGPTFSALSLDGDQREILSLLEKLFRVYHGHSAHLVCTECDPQQWEASVKLQAARPQSRGGA